MLKHFCLKSLLIFDGNWDVLTLTAPEAFFWRVGVVLSGHLFVHVFKGMGREASAAPVVCVVMQRGWQLVVLGQMSQAAHSFSLFAICWSFLSPPLAFISQNNVPGGGICAGQIGLHAGCFGAHCEPAKSKICS